MSLRSSLRCHQSRDFDQALRTLKKEFESQKVRPLRNNNLFMQGITAHNIGVIYVLAGQGHTAVKYFKEAVALKTEAFGSGHPEIAVSTNLSCLNESSHIYVSSLFPNFSFFCLTQ